MSDSYEELQGKEMDVKDHPDNNIPDPTASNNVNNTSGTSHLEINSTNAQTSYINQKYGKKK